MTLEQLDLFYQDATEVLSKYSEAGVVFTPVHEAAEYLLPLVKRLSKTEIIRILEPSSGTGNLLLALLNILSARGFLPSRVQIVSCELNSNYLKLQKKYISENFKRWENSITFSCGDFLSKNLEDNKFDLVVMNPPWVGYRYISDKDKEYIKQKFSLVGQFDLLDPFVIKCFQHLKAQGKMALFLPDKVLSSHQPSNCISMIKPLCTSLTAQTLPVDFFSGVQHESVFISLEKSKKVLAQIVPIKKSNLPTIGDHFKLFRGFEISGRASEYLVTEPSHALDPNRPFVSGHEMDHSGGLDLKNPRFISKKIPKALIKEHFEYNGPAILIRKTGSPVRVSYVDKLPHVSQVVFVIVPHNGAITKKALKQLAEYLRSDAGQKILSSNSGKLGRALFPYITISDLKDISLDSKIIDLKVNKKAS